MVKDDLDQKVYLMMMVAHENRRASTNERNEFWHKYPDIKEASRLFYMVKGHFTSESTMLESAPGYFKRLWYDGSNGAPLSNYEEKWRKNFLHFIEKTYVHLK